MHPYSHIPRRQVGKILLLLGVLVATMLLSVAQVHADGTNAPPANPSAVSSNSQFIVDHENDLGPFFSKHSDEMLHDSLPLFMALMVKIFFFNLFFCWVIDVLLARWFSSFFAPAFSKYKRSAIYASGRLVLSMLFTLLLGLLVSFVGLGHIAIILSFVALFSLVEFVVQAGWVRYLFLCSLPVSGLFYLGIFVMHIVTGVVISFPIISGQSTDLVIDFMNQSVAPKLQADADGLKQDAAKAVAARDKTQADVDDAHAKINQAVADQEKVRQQIEQKKVSETYLFSEIIKIRAKGDLVTARDRLNDLLVKFPNDPMTDRVKTQLSQVNSDIAIQDAQKKQAEADAIHQAAVARADLLARAGRGEVTLSEMRQALFGKSTAEITSLFGPPTDTASNRWGYYQRMIVNPYTGQKYGLTVYFADGFVQGVDYYYGTRAVQ